MKNLLAALLISIVSLCGCTHIIYTQEQVLDRYKTKKDVAERFGVPDQKKISDSTEAWLYIYDGHHPHPTA